MKNPFVIISGLFMVAIVAGAFLMSAQVAKQTLPGTIKRQLEFTALVPQPSDGYVIDSSTFQYDTQQKVLTFVASKGSNRLIIAEQTYPEVLVWDKLVGPLGEYDEVQTRVGKAALTRPKTLHGGQAAVVNANGSTLVFVRPGADLSKADWFGFFNSLKPVQ